MVLENQKKALMPIVSWSDLRGCGGEALGGAEVDVDGAAALVGRADGDVGEAVAVHVPERRQGEAEAALTGGA